VTPGIRVTRLPDCSSFTVNRVAFSDSYPEGGEPIAAADLDLTEVVSAFATPRTYPARVVYDLRTSTLRAYTAAGEAAPETDLSGLVVDVFALGQREGV
jgi:hypothetical protein